MFKVSLIMAMHAEAAGLISALDLKPFVPNSFYQNLQLQFFKGTYRDRFELTLTLPGRDPRYAVDSIGTEPAAVATFATVRECAPDLLINAGTCGSFAHAGAHIGKVYLSDKAFYFHDHRIPIAGWDQFGQGAYPSLNVRDLAKTIDVELADISSGNSLDYTELDLQMMKSNGAILKEMEAGAVACVAFLTETPLFAMKSVTNLIDTHPDSAKEFEKNFAVAVSELNLKLMTMFERLAEVDLAACIQLKRI